MRPSLNLVAGLVALLALGACEQFTFARDTALSRGGEFYDEALNTAIAWKCRASSVGAIRRKYMINDGTWSLWTGECIGNGAVELPEGATESGLPVPRELPSGPG